MKKNLLFTAILLCSVIQNYSSDTPPPLMMQEGQGARFYAVTPPQEDIPNTPLPPISSAIKASNLVQAVQSETKENSRLLRAVERQKPEKLATIKTADGSNLLMLAAYAGCPNYTKFLLQYINPNDTNNSGKTPLSVACLQGHHNIIPTLAEKTEAQHFPLALKIATHNEDVATLSTLLQYPYYEISDILEAAQIIKARHNGTHTIHPCYKTLNEKFKGLKERQRQAEERYKKEREQELAAEAENRMREQRQAMIAKEDAIKNKNHYCAILNLSEKFNSKALTRAYREKALQFHPDKHNGDDTMFKAIQHAYERLQLIA